MPANRSGGVTETRSRKLPDNMSKGVTETMSRKFPNNMSRRVTETMSSKQTSRGVTETMSRVEKLFEDLERAFWRFGEKKKGKRKGEERRFKRRKTEGGSGTRERRPAYSLIL